MPRTPALDFHWYDTPNIHLCTISDFVALVRESRASIERALALRNEGGLSVMRPGSRTANLFAQGAIFLLRGHDL
jgi:hypothetical protein